MLKFLPSLNLRQTSLRIFIFIIFMVVNREVRFMRMIKISEEKVKRPFDDLLYRNKIKQYFEIYQQYTPYLEVVSQNM
ncbi:MAG: hypothetical protein K8R86_03370 [Bacteroidales bacterium]|nr:hypothetical protein [Bacteroidales bacterium]